MAFWTKTATVVVTSTAISRELDSAAEGTSEKTPIPTLVQIVRGTSGKKKGRSGILILAAVIRPRLHRMNTTEQYTFITRLSSDGSKCE